MARRVSRLILSICLLFSLIDGVASAQTPTPAPPDVNETVNVRGTILGTAATGKTSLPLSDQPMTVDTVSSEVIADQGANDLVTALKNVPGVNAFTTYGVYEYYVFRGYINNLTDTDYFTAHLDYLQVYPGNPINAMATIRVRMK